MGGRGPGLASRVEGASRGQEQRLSAPGKGLGGERASPLPWVADEKQQASSRTRGPTFHQSYGRPAYGVVKKCF